jgi:hypothetical protein
VGFLVLSGVGLAAMGTAMAMRGFKLIFDTMMS